MRRCLFLLASIFLALLSLGAWAAGTTLLASGDVQVTPKGGREAPLAVGQRVDAGATLKTGANSGVTIRFDDGQTLGLTSNSNLVIDEYRFNPHKPADGGMVMSLVRGGLRTITGLIGKASPESVEFKTESATMGIRGTDFQLFFDGRLFISVQEGSVGAKNAAGETVFNATTQSLGIVQDAYTKARTTTLAEFSTDAIASMRRLDIEPNFGTRTSNSNDPSCSDRR